MNKLTLLVVEDIKAKQRKITGLLRTKGLSRKYSIAVAGSITSAQREMAAKVYDVVILDQYLPEWDSDERPEKDGGLRLLREIHYTEHSRRPGEVIVLSEFRLQSSSQDAVGDYGCLCIAYDEIKHGWKHQLVSRLECISKFFESRRAVNRCLADFAILTAHDTPEFDPFRAMFFKRASRIRVGETRLCFESKIQLNGVTARMVGVPICEMGLVAACEATMNVINRYRPRVVIISGIAGKVADSVELCDVIVADQSWNYDAGKWIEDKRGTVRHQPEPKPIGIDGGLRALCADFARDPKVLSELRACCDSIAPVMPKRKRPLEVKVGPVVSGSAVVESKKVVARAAAVHRKTLALEMEIFGVYHACKYAFGPKPLCIGVKAICDKARRGGKTDKFQRAASELSALFIKRLLETKGKDILALAM